MKLIDKLKNVFFEEVSDEEDDELPQTFAKKVEVPKKTEEVSSKTVELSKRNIEIEEETNEEDVKTFEVPSKREEKEEIPLKEEKEFPMMFDDDDFLAEKNQELEKPVIENDDNYQHFKREIRDHNDDSNLYQGKKEMSYVESVNSKNSMSYTKSYYEEKETKGFRPSPIISPIYGILDKNYHKEEVVTKKETRIVTASYGKPDLDSIRNKAFGGEESRSDRIHRKNDEEKENSDLSKEEYKKVYDVNNNKPQVNKVTLADADEYYNDLGLAYNVDYSDASRNNESRTSRVSKDKKKNKSVDDNLFDLIDSMYNKED